MNFYSVAPDFCPPPLCIPDSWEVTRFDGKVIQRGLQHDAAVRLAGRLDEEAQRISR